MTFKKGYKMTEEHKRKIIEANKIALKGRHCSPKTEFKKGRTPWNKGKKFPEFSRENSPSWKGGIAFHIQRKIIREEGQEIGKTLDKCQICKEKPKKRIIIHHIDGDRYNNNISNIAPLCDFCHNAIHDTPNKIRERFQLNHPIGVHY